jgi:hypothetical protein
MMKSAAMVMRKIYVNGRRSQSSATGAEPFDLNQHFGKLAAGCNRLNTTSKNEVPRNIEGDCPSFRDERVSQDARCYGCGLDHLQASLPETKDLRAGDFDANWSPRPLP